MKLPKQASSSAQTNTSITGSSSRTPSKIRSSQVMLDLPDEMISQPSKPNRAPIDHTLLRMMLSGCRCISPNCVALSCPARCVVGGKFVC